MKEPNSQRGTSAVRDDAPAHVEKAPDAPRSSLRGERRTVLAMPSPRHKSAPKTTGGTKKWSADQQPRRDPAT